MQEPGNQLFPVFHENNRLLLKLLEILIFLEIFSNFSKNDVFSPQAGNVRESQGFY